MVEIEDLERLIEKLEKLGDSYYDWKTGEKGKGFIKILIEKFKKK